MAANCLIVTLSGLLFAARCFLSASTPWDDFEQILTNVTNKIFSVIFARELVGVSSKIDS